MLTVDQLSSGYGNLPVIRDLNFVAKAGEITLVLGPNGAGKTTLLKTICGFIKHRSGSVRLDQINLGGLKPEQIARQGARLVLEGHRVFPELSVEDNIRLGQVALSRSERRPDQELFERAYEVFPILGEKRKLHASGLSGGQQQMLALVQAWSARPKVLLCDEPSLGLAQSLIPDILRFLRSLADEDGMAVVLVEQLVQQPLAVADRVVFLRQGTVLLDEGPEKFADPEYVSGLMTGPIGVSE